MIVAPRAGAWIEILVAYPIPCAICVAPRAGAWIEIGEHDILKRQRTVAPRAGAWIEIRAVIAHHTNWVKSPLAQGRGLKLQQFFPFDGGLRRPSRRGVD